MAEEELLRQIQVMKEMGFGGFFMHSRTGLDTEYLGEEWFELTRSCVREGEKQGLQPWIYDEDRWPSGSAGGKVTKDPRFRRRILTLSFEKTAEPLALFAARVDGLRLESWRQIRSEEELQAGERLLCFTVRMMKNQSGYNGYTDVDRLNLAATERFLEITHQQYKEQCGEEFSGIFGVFTDEPHRGMVFSDFSDGGQDKNWSLPWTGDLPQAFYDAYGEDLIPQLPALYLQPQGEPVAPVKWQYMELLQRLFICRFLVPIQKWAGENGIRTTGHFLHEDTLMAQAVPAGSMMRCYPYLDEPGIDSLTDNRYIPWAVKALESVARQLEKPFKLSELFGATGWHMSFRDYKGVADWQTVLGINVRCPHLSWYTMKGEAKRDYPGSFLHQATWYREHNALETYFSRLAIAANSGKPLCDTLVIHPIESLWCQIHPGWANGLDAADPAIQRIEQDFVKTFTYLMQTQQDFDYGDEGLLAEHGSVEQGVLCFGAMEYRKIVVSGCVNLRGTTYRLLEKFRAQGGELIFLGTPPKYVDCARTALCRRLAARSTRLPLKKQAVLAYFDGKNAPVRILDRVAAEDFYLQQRQTEGGLTAVLWNKSRSRSHQGLAIRVPAGTQVQLWNCFSGERTALPVTDGQVRLDLAPGQEQVLRLAEQRENLPPDRQSGAKKRQPIGQPVGYSLDESNVFVLDMADLWLDGQKLAENGEILDLDRILRTALGLDLRGGEMLQPWAREKQTHGGKPIRLRYRINMETLPQEPVTLALEPMEHMTLTLNGQPVPLEQREGFWIDNCFRLYRLPNLWKTGSNTLELTADYGPDSGLEAMFLLGSFGVWMRGGVPAMGRLPKNLKIGSIVHQGLPFYSGKVRYEFDIPAGEAFALCLPKVGGTCAVADCGGKEQLIPWEWEMPAWSPEENDGKLFITAVLNRRNTFGPLHRFPVKQPHVAPDSFVCDDRKYALYPMGLLRAPETAVSAEEERR